MSGIRLDDLRHPAWVEDGMQVWIRYGTSQMLRCTVQTAAGDAARVVCPSYSVDRVLPFSWLYVMHDDPHARPARLPAEIPDAR